MNFIQNLLIENKISYNDLKIIEIKGSNVKDIFLQEIKKYGLQHEEDLINYIKSKKYT